MKAMTNIKKRCAAHTALSAAIIAIVMAITSGCQNDAQIGLYYGTWAINSMTVNGEEYTATFVPDMSFFSFQTDVLFIERRLNDLGDVDHRYGTWEERDGGRTLRLNFTHSDDAHPAGTDYYKAPEWLLMPTNTMIDLKIIEQSGRRMTLQYDADNGDVIVYTLHKTW